MKFLKRALSVLVALSIVGVAFAESSTASLAREVRSLSQQTANLQKQVSHLQARLHKRGAKRRRMARVSKSSIKKQMKGQSVMTTPLFGVRSAYNASDLMVSYPSMNEDLILLQQRAHWQRFAQARGRNFPGPRPIVLVSGKVEAQALWTHGYDAGSSVASRSAGDVNLSSAELDFNVPVSNWADGMISLAYEDASTITGDRSYDSPLYLNRGFLTIGNLNRFPFYFSIGQMYVPFGVYSSGMVTTPSTQSLGRINSRTALLGFSHKGFYGSVYGFKGSTLINSHDSGEWGVNLGVKPHLGIIASDLGVGYVSNIADSQGMQYNALSTSSGGTEFLGFSRQTGSGGNPENLLHRVGAVDLHDTMQMGPATFLAEYITSLGHFDGRDLSYNNQGAKPKALQLELNYKFDLANKPSSVGIAYGHVWEGLALLIPQRSYSAFFHTSLWRNTIESIEFRHDVGYGSTATGGGFEMNNTSLLQLRGDNNTVTGQIGIYF